MLGELEKRVGYHGGELMEVAAGFFRKLVFLMYSFYSFYINQSINFQFLYQFFYRLNARNFHKKNNGSNRFKIV